MALLEVVFLDVAFPSQRQCAWKAALVDLRIIFVRKIRKLLIPRDLLGISFHILTITISAFKGRNHEYNLVVVGSNVYLHSPQLPVEPRGLH